tara:strand:- start:1106 stop:1975 length:870 start_codon:yes stop_codon:yes gene_type:complete
MSNPSVSFMKTPVTLSTLQSHVNSICQTINEETMDEYSFQPPSVVSTHRILIQRLSNNKGIQVPLYHQLRKKQLHKISILFPEQTQERFYYLFYNYFLVREVFLIFMETYQFSQSYPTNWMREFVANQFTVRYLQYKKQFQKMQPILLQARQQIFNHILTKRQQRIGTQSNRDQFSSINKNVIQLSHHKPFFYMYLQLNMVKIIIDMNRSDSLSAIIKHPEQLQQAIQTVMNKRSPHKVMIYRMTSPSRNFVILKTVLTILCIVICLLILYYLSRYLREQSRSSFLLSL